MPFGSTDTSPSGLPTGASLARKAVAVLVVFPVAALLVGGGLGYFLMQDHQRMLVLGAAGVPVDAQVVAYETRTRSTGNQRDGVQQTMKLHYELGATDAHDVSFDVGTDEAAQHPVGSTYPLLVLPGDPSVWGTPAAVQSARDTPPSTLYTASACTGAFVGGIFALLFGWGGRRRRRARFPWSPTS